MVLDWAGPRCRADRAVLPLQEPGLRRRDACAAPARVDRRLDGARSASTAHRVHGVDGRRCGRTAAAVAGRSPARRPTVRRAHDRRHRRRRGVRPGLDRAVDPRPADPGGHPGAGRRRAVARATSTGSPPPASPASRRPRWPSTSASSRPGRTRRSRAAAPSRCSWPAPRRRSRPGSASTVVISFASNQRSARSRSLGGAYEAHTPEAQFEQPYGPLYPASYYAMAARQYLHKYAATREDLAEVAVAAREWALLNPAAFRYEAGPLTVDDVLDAPMVSTPLTAADCCLVTDGGGAIVLTSLERARDLPKPPIAVLGYGESTTNTSMSAVDDLTVTGAVASGAAAFGRAGLTPADVDVAQVYDSFTITVLLTLEALGFCGPGEAAVASSATEACRSTPPAAGCPTATPGSRRAAAGRGGAPAARRVRRAPGARRRGRARARHRRHPLHPRHRRCWGWTDERPPESGRRDDPGLVGRHPRAAAAAPALRRVRPHPAPAADAVHLLRRDRRARPPRGGRHRRRRRLHGRDAQPRAPTTSRRTSSPACACPRASILLSNIETAEPDAVAIGDAVRLGWRPLDDGRALPVFHPTDQEN